MTRDEFLSKIEDLAVWRSGGVGAAHKLLLLLLELSRILQGAGSCPRLIGFSDVEDPLRELLRTFGPRSSSNGAKPHYPFWRLRTDGLWEIPSASCCRVTRSNDVFLKDLRRYGEGGFPEPVFALLRSDVKLIHLAVQTLLQGHFPQSLHGDILDAAGLPREWELAPEVQNRDPAFRERVLREYESRCVICEDDLRLNDRLVHLEAAHIKWLAYGGPNTVGNGLALCGFHHKAFDLGAIGMQESDAGLDILVSKDVNGTGPGREWLVDYAGRPVRPPQSAESLPCPDFVEWHRKNIFHGPARDRN